MAKATKQFKIGEYVVGGIIRANVTGKVIEVKFQDYYSKEDIYTGSVMADEKDAERKLYMFLSEHGTSYYADEVIKWIKSKVELKSMFDW